MKNLLVSLFFFLLLSGCTMFMEGANSMSLSSKESKDYRYYSIKSFYDDSRVLPVQIAIAEAIEQNKNLLELDLLGVTPLHLLTDPMGESYKEDAKLGPTIYVRTIQNMPINFLTAIQVFSHSDSKLDLEERCISKESDQIFCIAFEVHEYVRNHPIILDAIKDSLSHPYKYLKKENIDIWVSYSANMIEMAGGKKMLLEYPSFYWGGDSSVSIENYLRRYAKEIIDLYSDDDDYLFLQGRKIINLLRYINNEGKIVDQEFFDLDNKRQ